MDEIKRETESSEKTRHADRLVIEASDVLRPHGGMHIGSITLHFYTRTNIALGNHEILLMTQRVNWNMSKDAAGVMLPEVRDRVIEALGGQKVKMAPKTNEELQDLGGEITAHEKKIIEH